ncbi:MAG TPA: serine/threonine-protein kinase [Polyangiaceae bacterium]|nr:serine/threonine-protein kinase [Polyangiaceae bacterium]
MTDEGEPLPEASDSRQQEAVQAEAEQPDLSSGLVADRYRVMERIGQGGMGSVYRAQHVHMKKAVALKVLHRDLTRQPEAVARFEREAIAAGSIDHPNIAKATDFGRLSDGSFFLVLEYVQGKTLSQLLRERTVGIDEALEICKQVSSALSAAHAAGIVHRDLKPDNVMLVERPGEPDLVKVLDFGIAKLSSPQETTEHHSATRTPLTRLGSVFGTPEYMAPEQASGSAVDQRADLYALGITLYRMLAGTEPFVDEDVAKVLMQQVTQAPPPLPASVGSELRSLVSDLLHKDPARRIQTADDAYARIVFCQMRRSAASRSWLKQVTGRFELFVLKNQAGLGGSTLGQRIRALPHDALQSAKKLGTRTVTVRGRAFRIWPGLVGGVILTVVIVLLVVGGDDETAANVAEPQLTAVPKEAAVAAAPSAAMAPSPSLLRDALAGSPEAIAELEQRPISQRSTEEWLALAQGRATLERYSGAIEAYQEAILREPSVASNPELAHNVWLAAGRAEVAEQALRFAARHLGSNGADLLYKVWVDLSKAVTPTTALAKELLQSPSVQKVVTPALKVAIELRSAEDCETRAKLLPRVMLYGDARAGRVLRRLQTEQECSEQNEQIEATLAKLKDRPEPRF